MASNLTDKQEKFVLAVVSGKTQADAYRLAYNTSKMTDKSIHEKASALMADVKVKSRYNELRGKVIDKLEQKAICTVEGLLNDLQAIKEISLKTIPVYKKTEEGFEQIGEQIADPTAALKSIELMGKHLKMFTDKVEHSGKIEMPQITITK